VPEHLIGQLVVAAEYCIDTVLQVVVKHSHVPNIHREQLAHYGELGIVPANLVQAHLRLQDEVQHVHHFEAVCSQLDGAQLLHGYLLLVTALLVQLDMTAQPLYVLGVVIHDVAADPCLRPFIFH
jgi:hypothetical protein